MTARRRGMRLATGARLAAGSVVAVGAVAAVVAGIHAPWPNVSSTPAMTSVTPMPGDAVLACTGSFRALGREAADAEQMQAAAASRLTVGGPTESERGEMQTPELVGAESAPVFTAAAEGREGPLAAASESMDLNATDLSGLAAGACGAPATESWIVGGSTRTGSGDVLVLSNPGEVTATVALTLFADTPASSNVVVPAKTQLALPFAALAAGAETPVVRVTAEGAPIRATLQSALVSVLDPAGIDLQPAMTEPRGRLVFPGVQVVADSDGGSTANVLRLLAPGNDDTANVTVRGADGRIAQEFTAPIQAGVPLDVALSDLPIDDYSVEVTAGSALVGAVWRSTGTGPGTDFSWMPPSPNLGAQTTLAVPPGPNPRLHLVADDATTVTLTDDTGREREIDIAAGASAIVPLAASTVYRLAGDEPVRAAVTMSADGRLAGWPVEAGAASAAALTVLP